MVYSYWQYSCAFCTAISASLSDQHLTVFEIVGKMFIGLVSMQAATIYGYMVREIVTQTSRYVSALKCNIALSQYTLSTSQSAVGRYSTPFNIQCDLFSCFRGCLHEQG